MVTVDPWLSTLRSLAVEVVTLVLCQVTCRLTLVGLQCLWIPWSCGVPGVHDGVTCLRSGLCSSSVRDRDVCFPSFGGFDYWPLCGVPCLRMTLCASACVGSGGCPSFSRVGSCSFALGSSSLDLVGVGGFHRVPSPLSSFGMWSPFGVNGAFLSLLIANEGFPLEVVSFTM